jgi:hypothetical protein
MGMQERVIEAVVAETWNKLKAAVGEGGQALLANPWPLITTFRFLADALEGYARSRGLPGEHKKGGGE